MNVSFSFFPFFFPFPHPRWSRSGDEWPCSVTAPNKTRCPLFVCVCVCRVLVSLSCSPFLSPQDPTQTNDANLTAIDEPTGAWLIIFSGGSGSRKSLQHARAMLTPMLIHRCVPGLFGWWRCRDLTRSPQKSSRNGDQSEGMKKWYLLSIKAKVEWIWVLRFSTSNLIKMPDA